MSRDLVRLMHALLTQDEPSLHETVWRPAADVHQTRDGWLVKFDLAGVRPEDVRLSVAGRRLTVRGTRRDATLEESCHCYRMEIAYSHFERSLELPYDLERAHITTEYREGMLFVRVRTEPGSQA
jgi:HSP20 family protein